ncbi:MAG: YceI family protein [Verrucomicrobiota bacterium]
MKVDSAGPSGKTFAMNQCIGSVALSLGLFVVAGCSDPADKVHKSAASKPVKTESAGATNLAVGAKEYVVRTAESKIDFVGSKVTGKHDGGFKNFAGTIQVADGKIVGSPEFKINMKTLWADNAKLTGHLKSADFFDVEKYPSATFVATTIEPSGDHHNVVGNLDLHGVTKSISFPAKIEITEDAATINADFAINRKEFNINYPGKTDDLIRDNVALKLAIKASPGALRPEDQITN